MDVIVWDGRRGREILGGGHRRRICRLRRMTGRQEVIEAVEGVEDGEGGCGRNDPFGCGVFEVLKDDVNTNIGSLPAEAVDEIGWHYSGEESRDASLRSYISAIGQVLSGVWVQPDTTGSGPRDNVPR